MFMYIEFVQVLSFLLTLHHILSQDLRHALRMLERLAGFDAAAFESRVFAELLFCEGAGGSLGLLIV